MTQTDLVSVFADTLREAGLDVSHIEADGQLHRCGTLAKPVSKNGAYIVHLDAPASLWWQNWQTGDSGTVCAVSAKDMTPAEKEALKARVAASKAEAARAKAERHAKTATLAKALWDAGKPASQEHPYLVRKGVPALGLRQRGELLVVPVLNESGKPQSLQYILPEKGPDGDKLFLAGGKKQGGFFSIPAKDGEKSGALLIAEGYATAASLHMATGYAVLVAFDAGNLKAVATMARRLYPEREIILCADNDATTEGNPGVKFATAAAQAIGAKLAVPPLEGRGKVDFNDYHLLRGELPVREVVDSAKTPQMSPDSLRVVNLRELLAHEAPRRGYVLFPVVPEQGLCMLFAERGVGKTFVGLSAAYAVASGGELFAWRSASPEKVLYIDGEMPFSAIQERLAAIVAGAVTEPPEDDYLRVLTPDLQGDLLMPNLATSEGQRAVEPFLEGVKLVVVDNLATLARAGRSNDEESWLPVQEWVLSLRRRGISVLLVHHASKSGSQRGTSAKEDVLDVVIQLRRPADYSPEEGARFEVHLTKARGIFGTDAEPFEARLVQGGDVSRWEVKTLESSLLEQIRLLAEDGLSVRDIADELGTTKTKIGRLCREHGIATKGGRR